jgi:UDPglucose--hexose-1-phosphate uridylyltransferase
LTDCLDSRIRFELFAETQRDITPEQAAEKLRDAGDVHWKTKH